MLQQRQKVLAMAPSTRDSDASTGGPPPAPIQNKANNAHCWLLKRAELHRLQKSPLPQTESLALMKILLATPAHGGMVCLGYHQSILSMYAFFRDEFPGIQFEDRSVVCSVLPLARNILASMLLNDKSFTHLLFVDSDMGFSPSMIAKMIAFQKPLVGCIYPMKQFDYDWFHASGLMHKDPLVARMLANDYVGGQGSLITTTGPNGERQTQVVEGFVKVSYAGTGIMLIHRDVLQAIKDRFPELWVPTPSEMYRKHGLKGGVLQCFDSFQGADGLFPGEDIAFCRRWVDGCGGEIWSCVDEAILHIGQENFVGHYLLKMQHGDALAAKPPAALSSMLPIQESARPVTRSERRAMRRAR
jgi:hypothetical protein